MNEPTRICDLLCCPEVQHKRAWPILHSSQTNVRSHQRCSHALLPAAAPCARNREQPPMRGCPRAKGAQLEVRAGTIPLL